MKTTEQEFMELYGEERVSFSSYSKHKYRVLFSGATKEGCIISLVKSGDSSDIYYKLTTIASEIQVKDMSWNSGIVDDKNGKEIHWFKKE
jgi:hypothetical protein